MNLNHYQTVFFKILSTPYPYSKFQLLFSYCKLIIRSIIYHKFYRNTGVHVVKNITLMGWSVHFSSYPQLISLLEEIFIFQVYNFTSTTTAHPIIVDCGSNIGLSILYFKTLYPQCTIIAFEPDPDAFELLHQNMQHNRITNVTLHNLAVRSQPTETVLHQNFPGGLTTSVFQTDNTKANITTKSCRLSDYLPSSVSLVKLDVEGSEAEILNDLVNTNKLRQCEKLIIEFHPRLTCIPTQHLDHLITSNGFVQRNKLAMGHQDEIIAYQRQ